MIPALGTKGRRPLKLMIVAGEASGDKHGGSLASELSRLNPDRAIEMFGAGGESMRAAGVDTLVDAREMAVMGVPEIAAALGRFYKAYRSLVSAGITRKPDAAILIDWPDFNLRLARRLHLYGIKVIYYISPQVWAWRKYRVNAIRRNVDRMLVILPFERDFYRNLGIDARYVGHPLATTVGITSTRADFAVRHALDPARPIVSLLPGSRGKEIHYHIPPMLDAVRLLSESAIDWSRVVEGASCEPSTSAAAETIGASDLDLSGTPQFVIPLASTVDANQVRMLIGRIRPGLTIIERDTYDAVGHSCFAIVASGTATIETAILGTPMVIIYKGSELNWRLIRPLIHLDTFGMANLIAERKIVPELIQHDVTGPRIAKEVLSIMSDSGQLARMRHDLAEVRRRLASADFGGYQGAARAVMEEVSGNA